MSCEQGHERVYSRQMWWAPSAWHDGGHAAMMPQYDYGWICARCGAYGTERSDGQLDEDPKRYKELLKKFEKERE